MLAELGWAFATVTSCKHGKPNHKLQLAFAMTSCHVVAGAASLRWLLAALPKERRRYDSQCKELTKQLEQKVAQYNKLLPYGQLPGRTRPSMDDLKSQRFCWVEEYAGRQGAAHIAGWQSSMCTTRSYYTNLLSITVQPSLRTSWHTAQMFTAYVEPPLCLAPAVLVLLQVMMQIYCACMA
jgi:hypothetical protein